MSRTEHVACLAGDGVGARADGRGDPRVRAVSRLHGFEIDELHVPFGANAFACRPSAAGGDAASSSQRTPCSSRAGEPALEDVEAELDLRPQVARVRFSRATTCVSSAPLGGSRASGRSKPRSELAESRRARLPSIADDAWRVLVDEA